MQSSIKRRKNLRHGPNRGGIALGIIGFLLLAAVFFAIGYFFLGPRISPASLSAQHAGAPRKPEITFGTAREPESTVDIPDLKITKRADSAKPKESVEPAKESSSQKEENSITVTMDSGSGEMELKDKTPSKTEAADPKPKARPAVKAEKPSASLYRVQAGAYANRENAERLAKELMDRGYNAAVRSTSSGDRTLYRVQLGLFKSRSEAQALIGHLQDDGYQPAVSIAD
ncbi:MAG: SPOR domain-containing protein [Armatimonadota bacterium]|jgi:cell division protein FtsN